MGSLFLASVLVLNTFSVDFERKVVGRLTEVTKGTIYYEPQKRTILETTSPLHQMMVFDQEETIIYYPEENRAFLIKEKNGLKTLSFFQMFIGAMKEDYGLTEAGYTLKRHEKKDNILYTYWNPPKKMEKFLGIALLGMSEGKFVYMELKMPDGKAALKVFFKDHIRFGDKYLPRQIYTEVYEKAGITKEYVTYSDVKINPLLPDRILNFRIPEYVEVRGIK